MGFHFSVSCSKRLNVSLPYGGGGKGEALLISKLFKMYKIGSLPRMCSTANSFFVVQIFHYKDEVY